MICLKPGSSSTWDLGRYSISAGIEQRTDVSVGLGREPLEPTEAIQLGAGNDQNTFVDFLSSSAISRVLVSNS